MAIFFTFHIWKSSYYCHKSELPRKTVHRQVFCLYFANLNLQTSNTSVPKFLINYLFICFFNFRLVYIHILLLHVYLDFSHSFFFHIRQLKYVLNLFFSLKIFNISWDEMGTIMVFSDFAAPNYSQFFGCWYTLILHFISAIYQSATKYLKLWPWTLLSKGCTVINIHKGSLYWRKSRR